MSIASTDIKEYAVETMFKVEVTPKYADRKFYDAILRKDGYSYEKSMPMTQIIANMQACNKVKMIYNGRYYPVTLSNVVEVANYIYSGVTPTVTAVDAGTKSIKSYLGVVDNSKDLLGKVNDQFADIEICGEDVLGVLYPITGFTAFNGSNTIEQSGYYLPFAWTTNDAYTGAKMSVINGSNPTKEIALDTENLIWLGSTEADAFKKIIKITATKASDSTTVTTYLRVRYAKYSTTVSPYIAKAV